MKYRIPKDGTIFEHAVAALPDSSKSTIRSWIEHKRITVDGKAVFRADTIVKEGSLLELRPKPLPKEGPVRIRYEDQHLVVIEKPSGVLSVANEKKDEPSAHDWIKQRYPGKKIFVVHRIDKDTSGLMLFALSQEAYVALKEELLHRRIERVYEAIVEGSVEEGGTWDSYLYEDSSLTMRVVSSKSANAERAITHYTVLSQSPCFTILECRLETGKKKSDSSPGNSCWPPYCRRPKVWINGPCAKIMSARKKVVIYSSNHKKANGLRKSGAKVIFYPHATKEKTFPF